MKRWSGFLSLSLIGLIVFSIYLTVLPQSTFASGCSLDPSNDRLVITSTVQQFALGAISGEYRFEIENQGGEAVSSDCKTVVSISISSSAATVTGSNSLITIPAGTSSGQFTLTGISVGQATVSLNSEPGSSLQQLSGTSQAFTVTPPAPITGLISYVNNPGNIPDTINGQAGAVLDNSTISLYGINDGSSVQISGSFTANSDGSFAPINIGVDQYRQIGIIDTETVSGISIPGPESVVSARPDFPEAVLGLTVTHGQNQLNQSSRAVLNWTADSGSSVDYLVYRGLYGQAMTFLGNSNSATYVDNTVQIGQAYQYSVKSYSQASQSSSPEYSNIVNWKADIYQANISPAQGINLSSPTNFPTVTFSLTQEAADLLNTADSPKVDFINQGNNQTYSLPITALGSDQYSATLSSLLPDGTYQVIIAVNNQQFGPGFVADQIVLSDAYYIDLTAPVAPLSGFLRYDQATNKLNGLAGIVPGGDQVKIYSDNPPTQSGLLTNIQTLKDGSFEYILPSGLQNIYLWSVDQFGNLSKSYLAYSLTAASSSLSLQNVSLTISGNAHLLAGKLNQNLSGQQILVYSSDPTSDQNVSPKYSTQVLTDGTFNLSLPGKTDLPTIWLAIWNGLSDGSHLIVGPVISLSNSVGLSSVNNFQINLNRLTANLSWSSDNQANYYTVTISAQGSNEAEQILSFGSGQTSGTVSLPYPGNWTISIVPANNLGDFGPAISVNLLATLPQTNTLSSYTSESVNISMNSTQAPESASAVSPSGPILNQPKSVNQQQTPVSSNNWTGWALLAGLLIIIIAGLVGYYLLFVNQNENNDSDSDREDSLSSRKTRSKKNGSAKKSKNNQDNHGSNNRSSPPPKPRW